MEGGLSSSLPTSGRKPSPVTWVPAAVSVAFQREQKGSAILVSFFIFSGNPRLSPCGLAFCKISL